MAFKFDYTGSNLNKGLDNMSDRVGVVALMYFATKASEFQTKMKLSRPWTDRTSMAKAMLTAKVSQPSVNVIRMTLAHGVDYGIWLELANEQNYAIIGPTIKTEGPKLIEGLSGIMSRIGGNI